MMTEAVMDQNANDLAETRRRGEREKGTNISL